MGVMLSNLGLKSCNKFNIVEILDLSISTLKKFSDLKGVLYEHKKGDKIKLTVAYPSGRQYKEKQIEITLS